MLRAVWTVWLMLTVPMAAATTLDIQEGTSPALAAAPADRAALSAAVDDLCDKHVALLGEALHGDGHTDAFKVALVEQLVTKCSYNAVFFEASHYDFLAIARNQRLGKAVTPDMISSAIGGLWKFDREFQPLVPFLSAQLASGHLLLGGVDGQLGSFEAFYSNDAMPAELTNDLPEARRPVCREMFRRRLHWDYPETTPYSPGDQARLLQCAADVAQAIRTKAGDAKAREEQLEMVANIDRFIRLDFISGADRAGERDRLMYLNFRWLARRLPQRSKIIVWGATAHMASDATADPQFAAVKNFGSYVRRDYGDRAFALGFSAYSGSYRWSRKNNKTLEIAPPGSLEASAFPGTVVDTAYLGSARLRQLGIAPGAAFSHEYRIANWSRAVDAIVVFREEYPPHSTRPGYE